MAASVRRARSADSAAAAAVVRAVYGEYGFTWDEAGYHADLLDVETSFDGFWVAELEGEIVGCAGLAGGSVVLPDSDCSLERFYVLARARGGGIGSGLLRAVIERARFEGRAQLEIWSDKRFEEAHRLYRRFGAEVVSERVHDDPDESAEWGLVLRLAQPTSATSTRDVSADRPRPMGGC